MVKYSIYPYHAILKKNEVYLYIILTDIFGKRKKK